MTDAFKIMMMVADLRLLEDTEGVAGHVYILDASVVLPNHILKISPLLIKKFLICVQVSAFYYIPISSCAPRRYPRLSYSSKQQTRENLGAKISSLGNLPVEVL